ncbi:LysR family transcriptional regulator [Azospirillum sp. A39]|uniref:LysR family transcriptional regulator n=1 Tax=Azospirillum sp. A39 TaxID=3462279 RepID=UPI00404663B5
MDRLRAFEVFAAVVANGSFARAAEALNTSPANVTRYVKELENALRTRLLNRSSRRLSLTDDGRDFYDRIRDVLERVDEAEGLLAGDPDQPRGRLRINAPLSFGLWHLAPLWPRFLDRYPDIELDVRLLDRVVDLIEDGYDLAIRISTAGSREHVGRKLTTAHLVTCAAPAYIARHGAPARPDELPEHDCVSYAFASTGDRWPLVGPDGTTRLWPVRPAVQCRSGHAMRAAALAGRGLVQLPTFMIGGDLRDGTLVPVLTAHRVPAIDVVALYPSRRHLPAKVRAMVDFLVQAFDGPDPPVP